MSEPNGECKIHGAPPKPVGPVSRIGVLPPINDSRQRRIHHIVDDPISAAFALR
jgi:hypothetical protein